MRHPGLDFDYDYKDGITYMYIFKIGDDNTYKIGLTYDLNMRRWAMRSTTKKSVELIYNYEFNVNDFYFHSSYQRLTIKSYFEKWVHFKMKKLKLDYGREWYCFNKDELQVAIDVISNNKIIPFYSQFGSLRDYENEQQFRWYSCERDIARLIHKQQQSLMKKIKTCNICQYVISP